MSRFGRRRRQRKTFLGNFYLNPGVQYLTTIVSAILLAGFVFSGVLLFRFTDEEDLINRGRMQLAEGKVAWAAKTLQTLVARYPRSYDGHLLLGQAYLQQDERRKAEREFEIAASLQQKDRKDAAPSIALSKVAMAQEDYLRAEKLLLPSYRKDRPNKEIRQALFDLYERWGNVLSEKPQKDYPQIIEKYENALRYVHLHDDKRAVEEKLVDAIQTYTDQLIAMKEYDQAVHLLKLSLRHRYLPETMVQIAEIYNQGNKLDESIDWYRKAFDINPDVIGLRLTQVLMQKGQQLIKDKKPDEAKPYFAEADLISEKAKVSLDNLYPVSIASVKIETDIDQATGEFDPQVKINLSNDASRDLAFLAIKTEFMTGDEVLAEVIEQAATPDNPLPMKNNKSADKHKRLVSIKPESKLNIHALKDNKVTIKISIAYRDGNDAVWKVKSIQEATIRTRANGLQDMSPPVPAGQPV